jgi:DNA-binding NarL/FixJ family response regulator
VAANRIGVVVIDDHAMYRGGVRAALEADPSLLVIGETAGDPTALEKVAQVQPDALVIGVNPPGMAGLEAGRFLRRKLPRAFLLALATHPEDAGQAEAREAGFDRYLGKGIGPDELLALVRDGVAGRRAVAAEPQLRALPGREGRRAQESGWEGAAALSRRETEILHLVAQGQSNKEIALVLGISDQTVKNNITSLLRKLGVQDRTQAVIHALRHGWIEVSTPDAVEEGRKAGD